MMNGTGLSAGSPSIALSLVVLPGPCRRAVDQGCHGQSCLVCLDPVDHRDVHEDAGSRAVVRDNSSTLASRTAPSCRAGRASSGMSYSMHTAEGACFRSHSPKAFRTTLWRFAAPPPAVVPSVVA